MSARSYIDYAEVEPYKGPIQHTVEFIEIAKVSWTNTEQKRIYSYVEHQIQLEDSIF